MVYIVAFVTTKYWITKYLERIGIEMFEIILPALEPQQWIAGFALLIFTIIFGSLSAIFLKAHEETEDIVIGIVLGAITTIFLIACLTAFEIITWVFV